MLSLTTIVDHADEDEEGQQVAQLAETLNVVQTPKRHNKHGPDRSCHFCYVVSILWSTPLYCPEWASNTPYSWLTSLVSGCSAYLQ